jgi:hypothetical protein
MSEVSHGVIYLSLIATAKNPPRRRIRDGFLYPWRNYLKLISRTYADGVADVVGAGIFGALPMPPIAGPP